MTVWHLDGDLVQRYADGRVTPTVAASAEAHLLGCGQCRSAVAPAVAASRLDRIWDTVVDRVDAPRVGVVESLLLRAGVRNDTARLLAATPSLRVSWLTGVVIALVLAILAAQSGERGVAVFLALAPVLPLAGVAVAFGAQTDPVHELAAAAPYSSFRLLLVRGVAVLGSSLLLAGAAALLLPGALWLAAAWLLPALTLAILALALATRFDLAWSAFGLAVVWLTISLSAVVTGRDPLLAFRASAQLACLVAAVAGAVVLVVRRDALQTLGRSA